MPITLRHRLAAGAALGVVALGVTAPAHAYFIDSPAPPPAETAAPGPQAPPGWTVTTPTTPPAATPPAATQPASPAAPAGRGALTTPAGRGSLAARRVPRLAAAAHTTVVSVEPGDMLGSIARANGTTWQHLVRLNAPWHPGLATNPDLIQVGWHLVVPR